MNPRPLVAEFVGTFALIFVGVGSIAADAATAGHVGLVGIALAHGLTIAVMVSATAAVSGGHLNPAVTAAALTVGKIRPRSAAGYWAAQFLGGIVGAAALRLCYPAATLRSVAVGTPSPGAGVSPGEALAAEFFLTFLLMFVIMGTALDHRAPKLGGLFIGLAIVLDILMGGPVSGAAMNPARWLGPALLGGGTLGNFWIYFAGPVTGAVAAALLYHHVLAEKTRRPASAEVGLEAPAS